MKQKKLGFQVIANLAIFDTQLVIRNQTGIITSKDKMQGQPDRLANLQLLMNEFGSGREYTLVVNKTGESVDAVSPETSSLPDLIRSARTIVDVNFKQPIILDVLDIKFTI